MGTNTLLALIRLDNTLEEFGLDIKRLKEQFAQLDTRRKPLSDEAIAEQAVWAANTKHSFKEGVRWAEQQHGIGVGDE